MFIGLMGFTWLKASTIIRACKRDSDKKWAADLAAMLQVSLVGYATGGAFLGLAYFDYLYHLIVLVVITWTLVFKPDFYLPKPDKVELINKISQPKALETGSHAQIKPIPIIR